MNVFLDILGKNLESFDPSYKREYLVSIKTRLLYPWDYEGKETESLFFFFFSPLKQRRRTFLDAQRNWKAMMRKVKGLSDTQRMLQEQKWRCNKCFLITQYCDVKLSKASELGIKENWGLHLPVMGTPSDFPKAFIIWYSGYSWKMDVKAAKQWRSIESNFSARLSVSCF